MIRGSVHTVQIPEYKIEHINQAPFQVRREELPGWLIVPSLGETLSWGLYEYPSRQRTEYTEIEVSGKAQVHGIQGVAIKAIQYSSEDYYRTGCVDKTERRFAAQLTDTHSRFLAESHEEDGVQKYFAFLNGEAFLNNWDVGEDNCGNPVDLAWKGLLHRDGNTVTSNQGGDAVNIVGRYMVTINGKVYDRALEHFGGKPWSEKLPDNEWLTINGETYVH